MQDYVVQVTALGRVGLPNDVGGLVAFLCTEAVGWINGQRIELTGRIICKACFQETQGRQIWRYLGQISLYL